MTARWRLAPTPRGHRRYQRPLVSAASEHARRRRGQSGAARHGAIARVAGLTATPAYTTIANREFNMMQSAENEMKIGRPPSPTDQFNFSGGAASYNWACAERQAGPAEPQYHWRLAQNQQPKTGCARWKAPPAP
ncbi:hypothetical protein GCM10017559_82900 [Streptosporangium longisporum]|uniref:Uncharacterized protein n=1 Tax=Streptosporangium longisporum TaxID=46187 RepID=A0ABP6LHF1_9ACTN